jgi:hypothetical protein
MEAKMGHPGVVFAAAVDELLKRIKPKGFQVPVASGPAACRVAPQERFVDQFGDGLEDVAASCYDLGAIERERAGEHRKPREYPARLVREQVVAPLHRSAERTVPVGCVLRALLQEPEAIV